jgi:GNAT superfamily N-acetyltransferase
MVGYSSALISPHTYNPSIVCCNSDALFVRREWRPRGVGARLILETERVAEGRKARPHALAYPRRHAAGRSTRAQGL